MLIAIEALLTAAAVVGALWQMSWAGVAALLACAWIIGSILYHRQYARLMRHHAPQIAVPQMSRLERNA